MSGHFEESVTQAMSHLLDRTLAISREVNDNWKSALDRLEETIGIAKEFGDELSKREKILRAIRKELDAPGFGNDKTVRIGQILSDGGW